MSNKNIFKDFFFFRLAIFLKTLFLQSFHKFVFIESYLSRPESSPIKKLSIKKGIPRE
jgi:hypothetical protein